MRAVLGVVALAAVLAGAAVFVLLREPTATTTTTKPPPARAPEEDVDEGVDEEAPAPQPQTAQTPQQQAKLEALLTRGSEELKAGKSIYVLATAQEATATAPDDPRAWVLLGVAEQLRSRYDEAIEANRHALRLDPQNGEALYNLGCAFAQTKRFDDAFLYLQKSALGHPERRAQFVEDADLDVLHADPRWENLISAP